MVRMAKYDDSLGQDGFVLAEKGLSDDCLGRTGFEGQRIQKEIDPLTNPELVAVLGSAQE
jgi:hypothetical protein